jgi:hypothetical protein
MSKISFGIFICFLLATGCSYNDLSPKCYHGEVIMNSCCTSSSFINIDSSFPWGKKTTLNGKEYQNVIQVPGFLNAGNVYLNLRDFNRDKDYNLFPPIRCYCLVVIGMDVPTYVATAVSYSSCPNENLKDH